MTNVDVAALAAELTHLVVGSRVDRVYQPARDRILLRLRRKGAGRLDLLFELGRFVTLTRRPPANPDQPSMLAQTLRTQLENARVTGLRQVGFDRLLRLDLERGDGPRALVLELFGDGNLVLLDGAGTILLPMRAGEFSARRVRKGEPYVPPPGSAHPFGLDAAGLSSAAAAGRSKDLVRFLALDLGFGPLWAEELCLRANVEKATRLADLTPPQWDSLQAALRALGQDIARNDLAPALVHAAGGERKDPGQGVEAAPELVDAVPFRMLRYPAPQFAHEEAPTFAAALDAFFVGTGDEESEDEEAEEDPRRPRFEEAKGKLQRQVDQTEAAIQQFRSEEEAARADADALYAAFPQAQSLLEGLAKARAERPWAQVEAVLREGRAQGNAAALQVPELRPHNGTAVLRLDTPAGPRPVEVDLRLSVQENADAHFAAAKRAKSRREGAEGARDQALRRIAELEAGGLDAFGPAPVKAERRASRHFWFESYRWTLTPSGLVAVGGRNAAQNDAVVKKYLRDGDRYVHAEIHGAPSVVVRPAEGSSVEPTPEDLRAAAQFAVVASRAWRQAGPATAYWVTPAQVSKTPRSGEYVPKGAWIIHGKRNPEPGLPMRWWVGLVRLRSSGAPVPRGEETPDRTFTKLCGATLETLQRFADGCVRLEPGSVDAADAAQILAARFGVSVEEAQSVLPAGPVEIHEEPALPLKAGV